MRYLPPISLVWRDSNGRRVGSLGTDYRGGSGVTVPVVVIYITVDEHLGLCKRRGYGLFEVVLSGQVNLDHMEGRGEGG